MKALITILLIALVIYAAQSLFDYAEGIKRGNTEDTPAALQPSTSSESLPGFRTGYEAVLDSSLASAKKQGANGLRQWLQTNRGNVSDPRLAAIELDYVVLLGPSGRQEARLVLSRIKARLPPDSPVYARLQRLIAMYQ